MCKNTEGWAICRFYIRMDPYVFVQWNLGKKRKGHLEHTWLTKLISNFKMTQCWSNMNHGYVTALPMSGLKCLSEPYVTDLFSCIKTSFLSGCHEENIWSMQVLQYQLSKTKKRKDQITSHTEGVWLNSLLRMPELHFNVTANTFLFQYQCSKSHI